MTALLRHRYDPARVSGRDLLVATGIALLVAGVAGAVLGRSGLLVVGLGIGLLVAIAALRVPVLGLMVVLLATFTRNAQSEVLPGEVLLPALLLALVAVAVALVRRGVPRPSAGAVEWLMLAFLAWNLLSVPLPHEYDAQVPITGAPIDLERWFLSAIVLPFAVYQVARTVVADERAMRWLLGTVIGIAAVSAWLSIAQFHAPALTWPSYVVDAPNWSGRANGIFNQPVVNGVALVVGVVVGLFLAGRSSTPRWSRVTLYVLVAACTYSVYLTHTRAAVLGLAMAVVLGALLARGWRRGFVVLGALGVLGLASRAGTLLSADRSEGGFGSPSEIHDRLNIAATALHAIADHPVAGIGVGRFGMYNTYEHQAWSDAIDWSRGQVVIAHENSLGIGAEVGLPGLALWAGIVVVLAVTLWRARRVLTDDGLGGPGLAVVGLLVLAVMLVNGTTVDLRPLEFTTVLPLALVGAIVGHVQRHRDARPDEQQEPDEPTGGEPVAPAPVEAAAAERPATGTPDGRGYREPTGLRRRVSAGRTRVLDGGER